MDKSERTDHFVTLVLITTVIALIIFLALMLKHDSHPVDEYSKALSVTMEHLHEAASKCQDFHRMTGTWPTNITALTSVILVTNTSILTDGWGHQLVFYSGAYATNSMSVSSCGKDGLPGGSGEDADIEFEVNVR